MICTFTYICIMLSVLLLYLCYLYYICSLFVFYFLFIHCYLETLQHLGHIASRVFGCVPEGCVFILLCSHLLSSLILILWYMNLMNIGQMDRGNENPTQYLPWQLRKTTKKPQSCWSALGIEPGTSRMWVFCVTTEQPRSVCIVSVYTVSTLEGLRNKCSPFKTS